MLIEHKWCSVCTICVYATFLKLLRGHSVEYINFPTKPVSYKGRQEAALKNNRIIEQITISVLATTSVFIFIVNEEVIKW